MHIIPSFVPQAPLEGQITPLTAGTVSTGPEPIYPGGGSRLVVVMTTTQPVNIRFGTSSVGAATALDFRLEAKAMYAFEAPAGATHFRAIRAADATADAAIQFYVPGAPVYQPSKPPLPASVSVAEYWHSEIQCTSTAWVGQVGGRVMTGTGNPVVGVDPGHFNGRKVAKAVKTPGQYWSWTGTPIIAAQGAFHWIFIVYRMTTLLLDASFNFIGGVGRASQDADISIFQRSISGVSAIQAQSGSVVGPSPTDLLPHAVSLSNRAAPIGLRMLVDGVTFQGAVGIGGASGEISSAAAGFSAALNGNGSDANIAFLMAASSTPNDSEIQALINWSRAYWGTP